MDREMFIGIDIGGTHMRSALVDAAGNIVDLRKTPTDSNEGAHQTARRLIHDCRSLMEGARTAGHKVVAVGMGVAGKIDVSRGSVVFSPNLPTMRDYPLGREIQEDLGIPVAMENDANVFGIGEMWVGSGRNLKNWIGITLGTGVGGCLVFGGELWQGDNLGFVAEIGHMNVHPDGPLCACGLKGCLEAHSSGSALIAGVNAAVSQQKLVRGPLYEQWREGSLSPEAVYMHSKAGDPIARSLFERMGWALGIALASLFTVLGIRHAIIGGGVSGAWDQFIEPLRQSLADHTSFLEPGQMKVLRSTLGDDAAILGAASLASRQKGCI